MRFRKTLTFLTWATALVFALPAGAQQKNVVPSGAGPRPNAVRPYVACAAAVPALPPRAQHKPFTEEQVSNMVRDGFGDESGAKLIEQRGIDFAPSQDFCQTHKAAGASEAFLKALRAAKPPEPASAKKPLNPVQVFALLVGEVPNHRVTVLVQERGIDFEPTDDYLQEVRLAGGEDELISALKGAKVAKTATVDPAAQARQSELDQHAARGAELARKAQYAEAEQEFRAALLLDQHDAGLYGGLAFILGRQEKWHEGTSAARNALRLDPKDELAHDFLALAHIGRGLALEKKGKSDGAIAEYRKALRLNPNNELAHIDLGGVFGKKGDWEGASAECREALRLNPNLAKAHYNLGIALYEKGGWDDAIAEYREAIRLNPHYVDAHTNLGVALRHKGDLDGAIAEYRTALRLNPNLAEAHNNLGVALERKGDRQGALAGYRAAYQLDPKDALYKQNYERLVQQVNQ
jgi:Flp pilus assembly protein TadD